MATKPAAGLFKRGTVWYARFFIPADQQARLGREDISWSLKTGDAREARRRLPAMQARFEQLIAPPDPRREELERRFGIPANLSAGEALVRLQAMIAVGQAIDAQRWAEQRQQAAEVDPADFGLDLDRPEPPQATERDRLDALYGHRAEHSDYRTIAGAVGLSADLAAAAEHAATQLTAAGAGAAGTSTSAPAALTWDSLRADWELERKPARKTIIEARSSIELFTSQNSKPVTDLVKRDFTAFKSWLLTQPGRGGETLSAASATKRLNLLKTILAVAADNDVIPSNPAAGVGIKGAKDSDRQPFSRADLDLLFDPANLPDSQGDRLRMLIALYAGARLNEICQLRGADIILEDGIWCFAIDDAGDDQSVKNAGSRRLVPMHPVLVEAGIVEVAGQRGQAQLFDDLVWTETQGWSRQASKDINRHIRKLIPDARKVFHSFRHSFKDLCRDSGIAEDVHDRLTGHVSGSVGRGYGAGHSIRRLAQELGKIEGRWTLPRG